MTEQEWMECTDPGPMLEFLKGKASERKLRLFIVDGVRSLSGPWEWIEMHERVAEGQAPEEDLERIAYRRLQIPWERRAPGGNMPSLSESVRIVAADRVRLAPLKSKDMASKSRDAENVIMCAVLRDIFGNPFRPITLNAAWVTPNVNALAQTIYDDRAFERLPELTNALEHAKCDNEKILDHCRELGPHVRGCWVVDLVLGKR